MKSSPLRDSYSLKETRRRREAEKNASAVGRRSSLDLGFEFVSGDPNKEREM
jgi:hypothetical protein